MSKLLDSRRDFLKTITKGLGAGVGLAITDTSDLLKPFHESRAEAEYQPIQEPWDTYRRMSSEVDVQQHHLFNEFPPGVVERINQFVDLPIPDRNDWNEPAHEQILGEQVLDMIRVIYSLPAYLTRPGYFERTRRFNIAGASPVMNPVVIEILQRGKEYQAELSQDTQYFLWFLMSEYHNQPPEFSLRTIDGIERPVPKFAWYGTTPSIFHGEDPFLKTSPNYTSIEQLVSTANNHSCVFVDFHSGIHANISLHALDATRSIEQIIEYEMGYYKKILQMMKNAGLEPVITLFPHAHPSEISTRMNLTEDDRRLNENYDNLAYIRGNQTNLSRWCAYYLNMRALALANEMQLGVLNIIPEYFTLERSYQVRSDPQHFSRMPYENVRDRPYDLTFENGDQNKFGEVMLAFHMLYFMAMRNRQFYLG